MTSPHRMSTMWLPRDCRRPAPSVTYSVWPRAWECHAVRALGVKRTALTRIREGSSPLAMASIQTSPVNHSAGPLADGCFGRISIRFSFPDVLPRCARGGVFHRHRTSVLVSAHSRLYLILSSMATHG